MTVIEDHFRRYLVSLGYWPSADELAIAAREAAFGSQAVPGWQKWSETRQTVAVEQLTYKWTGIEVGLIDGLDGPQTQYAREAYTYWLENSELPAWRDADPIKTTVIVQPNKTTWPLQEHCKAFYGATRAEVESKLVFVDCPWTLKIAWDLRQTTSRIRIHQKCADSLREILAEIAGRYSTADIKRLHLDLYGGSFNWRLMRGGSSLSMHSFGCAIDWDPARNALHTRAPAAVLSHTECLPFWKAWEDRGWLSLGRARGYDWMHVQAARLG